VFVSSGVAVDLARSINRHTHSVYGGHDDDYEDDFDDDVSFLCCLLSRKRNVFDYSIIYFSAVAISVQRVLMNVFIENSNRIFAVKRAVTIQGTLMRIAARSARSRSCCE
jgi:hypothetical protein